MNQQPVIVSLLDLLGLISALLSLALTSSRPVSVPVARKFAYTVYGWWPAMFIVLLYLTSFQFDYDKYIKH